MDPILFSWLLSDCWLPRGLQCIFQPRMNNQKHALLCCIMRTEFVYSAIVVHIEVTHTLISRTATSRKLSYKPFVIYHAVFQAKSHAGFDLACIGNSA